MKIHDRTYTAATNACLFVGIASAFGFDKIHHVAWIVAGSCAGVIAIAMYFIRHWQRARGGEPVHEVSPYPIIVACSSEQQVLANAESDLTERVLKQPHRSVLETRRVGFVLETRRVGQAKLVINLPTTGKLTAMQKENKPRVYEFITPKSTGRIKQALTTEYVQLATATRSHKTMNARARLLKHSSARVNLFAEDAENAPISGFADRKRLLSFPSWSRCRKIS